VSITGPYFGYLDVCSGDADGDGECEEAEFDLLDAFIGDPDSGRAITVVKEDHPAPVPIAFTGMLRSDPRSIVDAKATQGLQFDQLGLTVSDRYLLVDQASPANGALSLAVAVAAGLLAAVLTIGLVGGYLVYRRSKAALPSGGRKLAAGQAIPLRVTGSLRRADGLIHVREASAQLVRFPLDVVQAALPEAAEPTPVDAAGSAEPTDVPTTLIVERQGEPEGVALGRGELKQVTAGRVMRFRGPRPALRVVAGTGALLLSFETTEERDRAAGELIGESGLLIQGSVAGGAG
jgi:hypothetical protein